VKSAVQAAVLSLVIEQPSYGGEIGTRFEERYYGLLASQRQHVYEALDRLRDQGMIEPVKLHGDDGSARDGYRATAVGARAYRGWLRSPIAVSHDTRRQVLVRLASTRAEDRETVDYLLERYEHAALALARKRPVRSGNVVDRALDEERRVLVGAQLGWIAWVRDDQRAQADTREP
jgi:DNA-binding PadR family transcriptional regulator